jgi:hypothetical protein
MELCIIPLIVIFTCAASKPTHDNDFGSLQNTLDISGGDHSTDKNYTA